MIEVEKQLESKEYLKLSFESDDGNIDLSFSYVDTMVTVIKEYLTDSN